MSSPAEIKRRLEQNWIQFLTKNSARLSMDTLDGSSPPSVFVGRYGYPKVRIGPMIPPVHGDTTVYDKAEPSFDMSYPWNVLFGNALAIRLTA